MSLLWSCNGHPLLIQLVDQRIDSIKFLLYAVSGAPVAPVKGVLKAGFQSGLLLFSRFDSSFQCGCILGKPGLLLPGSMLAALGYTAYDLCALFLPGMPELGEVARIGV